MATKEKRWGPRVRPSRGPVRMGGPALPQKNPARVRADSFSPPNQYMTQAPDVGPMRPNGVPTVGYPPTDAWRTGQAAPLIDRVSYQPQQQQVGPLNGAYEAANPPVQQQSMGWWDRFMGRDKPKTMTYRGESFAPEVRGVPQPMPTSPRPNENWVPDPRRVDAYRMRTNGDKGQYVETVVSPQDRAAGIKDITDLSGYKNRTGGATAAKSTAPMSRRDFFNSFQQWRNKQLTRKITRGTAAEEINRFVTKPDGTVKFATVGMGPRGEKQIGSAQVGQGIEADRQGIDERAQIEGWLSKLPPEQQQQYRAYEAEDNAIKAQQEQAYQLRVGAMNDAYRAQGQYSIYAGRLGAPTVAGQQRTLDPQTTQSLLAGSGGPQGGMPQQGGVAPQAELPELAQARAYAERAMTFTDPTIATRKDDFLQSQRAAGNRNGMREDRVARQIPRGRTSQEQGDIMRDSAMQLAGQEYGIAAGRDSKSARAERDRFRDDQMAAKDEEIKTLRGRNAASDEYNKQATERDINAMEASLESQLINEVDGSKAGAMTKAWGAAARKTPAIYKKAVEQGVPTTWMAKEIDMVDKILTSKDLPPEEQSRVLCRMQGAANGDMEMLKILYARAGMTADFKKKYA